MEIENEPYTWAQLKEFCNKLTDAQLNMTVKCIREDDTIEILDASEIGEDKYRFDDEEFSIGASDFDPTYEFDGKYATFEEALANEEWVKTEANTVFLFEKF
jgi:hypothetical protein